MDDKVVLGLPGLLNPFLNAAEFEVTGRDAARVAIANGYASHGEGVRRVRATNGRIREIWVGAGRMVSKPVAAAEFERRFGATAGKSRRAARRK